MSSNFNFTVIVPKKCPHKSLFQHTVGVENPVDYGQIQNDG